jgi:phosphatidylserine decarboxylase
MSLSDRLKALIQYPLPHHLLSKLMYWLTRCRWRPLKNAMIRLVIKRFNVDMSSAQEQAPESYGSFNEFFTRTLKPEARPVAAETDAIACPVDGTISQLGPIENGRIFQAKGHDYSLKTLVGGIDHLHDCFAGGHFATIYLSPRDYHRIHMPLDGELRESVYVPGRLFSVNAATTRAIPALFARNERLVSIFDTAHGPMAVILVGAIFVAGIETVWSGNYGDRTFRPFEHRLQDELPQLALNKGEEMGRFNMGSTVILLFPPGTIGWSENLRAEQAVNMGQQIGTLTGQRPSTHQD